jgi:nicotinamidase/pyrazinamidase
MSRDDDLKPMLEGVDPSRSALLLVDIQPDFMSGGALPVGEGERILPGVRGLMTSGHFPLQVATQDWHPPGHASFASSHPGHEPLQSIALHGHPQVLWPDHCVQGTPGAALHPELPWERVSAIVRKGMASDTDSYSGLRNNWNARGERPPTGLAGYLRERGVRDVYLCGLARDVCAWWTAQDAAEAGFDVCFLWDLTRAVDPGSDARVEADLSEHRVRVVRGTLEDG